MNKLMLWSEKHPIIVVCIVVLLNLLAIYKIKDVRIDASAEGMMIKGDPAEDYYRETLKKFGTDNITVIYVKDKDLFTPEKVAKLDDLAFALEEIEGVVKIESLFTVTNFQGEDGALNTNPLVDNIPETLEEAQKIKRDALRSPVLMNNLISATGDATAINLYVEADPKNPDFTVNFSRQVDAILAKYKESYQSVFQLGNTFTKRSISENILADQITLVPLSVLVLLTILVVSMRTASGAILPILTAGSSVLWAGGFMGLVDIPLNILTVIVPSLIIVIGSTEDMHLLSEYMEGMAEHGGIKKLAIKYMTSKCGTAVMLTALTTFLGFASITVNKIVILKQFGIVAAFGLFVNPLITCMVTPVYLKYFGPKKIQQGEDDKGLVGRFIHAFAEGVIKLINWNKWAVLGFLLGGAILLGSFTVNVKVDNDLLGYFKLSSDIRVRSKILHESIAGAQPFYIRISSGHAGTFKQPEALKQLEALQNYMKSQGWFDKTHSLADNIALIHREMNDGKKELLKVPDTPEMVAQYLLFLQRDEISRYVTSDYSEANILVRHNMTSSYELKRVMKKLNQFMAKNLNPHFIYGITGENILINKASDSMATGQAQSIGFLLVIIFIIMSILFVNMKAGALSLIPNFFPIVLFFGIMGILNIPLNTGTAMVAAIAIGIAVDDTIHFMARYNTEMRELQSQSKAMEVCIRSEIKPVISTSVALALGFAVICFSSFVPVIYFGFLSALVMIFALLGDMFVTPILLSSTQLITLLDMVGLKLSDHVIKDSQLFEQLKPRQIKKVILLGKVMEKEKDELAVRFGEHGESMFLILEGRARVLAKEENTNREIEVAEFGPGEVFGEVALVDPGPRSADVRATEQLKYIEIDWNGLHRIQRIFPRIAARLFLNLSHILGGRLVHTNKLLMEKVKE
jgi:uncharacterized protein